MVVPTLVTKVKTRPRSSGATVAWKAARVGPLATAARERTANGSDAAWEASGARSPRASGGDTRSHACRHGRADAAPEASTGSEREPAADGVVARRVAGEARPRGNGLTDVGVASASQLSPRARAQSELAW